MKTFDSKTGGELFDRILDKGYFTEDEAWHVMKQIGSAVHCKIICFQSSFIEIFFFQYLKRFTFKRNCSS